jgi:hypothetical protein
LSRVGPLATDASSPDAAAGSASEDVNEDGDGETTDILEIDDEQAELYLESHYHDANDAIADEQGLSRAKAKVVIDLLRQKKAGRSILRQYIALNLSFQAAKQHDECFEIPGEADRANGTFDSPFGFTLVGLQTTLGRAFLDASWDGSNMRTTGSSAAAAAAGSSAAGRPLTGSAEAANNPSADTARDDFSRLRLRDLAPADRQRQHWYKGLSMHII